MGLSAERVGHHFKEVTLSGVGTADAVNILGDANMTARSLFISNDSSADVTVLTTPPSGTLIVKSGEVIPLYGNVNSLTVEGAVGEKVRIFASERSGMRAAVAAIRAVPTASTVGEAELKDEVLFPASAAGRARLADLFFDAATLVAKFATDSIDPDAQIAKYLADSFTAAFLNKVLAAGALAAGVDGRAAMAAGYFDEATVLSKFGANSLSNENLVALLEDVTAEALGAIRTANLDGVVPASTVIAAGTLNNVALAHLLAAASITASVLEAKFEAGALSATALARAVMAAGYFDEATVLSKFGADSLSNENLVVLLEDVTAEALGAIRRANLDGVVPASTVIAAGTLNNVALAHLLATDSIDPDAQIAKYLADSFTAAFLNKVLAAGALAAGVDGRAAMAAGYFDEATVLSKFGANSLSNENLVALLEDVTAEALGAIRRANLDGVVPASTVIAAGTLNNVALAHLLATDSIDPAAQVAKWVAAGFDASFLLKVLAANCLDSTNVAAAVAALAIGATKLTHVRTVNLSIGAEAVNVIKLTGQVVDATGASVAAVQPVLVRIIAELAAAFTAVDGGAGVKIGTSPAGPVLAINTDATGLVEVNLTDVVGASSRILVVEVIPLAVLTGAAACDRICTPNHIVVTFDGA